MWTWTRAFGPSVGYGNSNSVECPCFVSGDTGMMAARKIKEATNYNGKNSKWTSKKPVNYGFSTRIKRALLIEQDKRLPLH